MAIISKKLDPIQSLIDYVSTVKPYHSKIIEVLEEYTYADTPIVTLTETIKFCSAIGISNLNSKFEFDIIAINTNENSVTLNGNATFKINQGQKILLEFSTLNNGYYYVTSIELIGTNTKLFLQESLVSSLVEGKVVDSVIIYCPDMDYKSTYIIDTPPEICPDGFGTIYDSFIESATIDEIDNLIIVQGDQTVKLSNSTTISLIDVALYPSDIIGVLTIETFVFDGTQTLINVTESITALPNYSSLASYDALIHKIGYDTTILCDTTTGASVPTHIDGTWDWGDLPEWFQRYIIKIPNVIFPSVVQTEPTPTTNEEAVVLITETLIIVSIITISGNITQTQNINSTTDYTFKLLT